MYRFARSTNANGFRSDSPLSLDTIAQYAPSVLAESAHESRAERYTFIPTIEVLQGLQREGFQPFEVRQTKVRDLDRRDYTKHMVRLRHPDAIASRGTVPEIVLLNSHDGSSSYQLLAGFFRFVCSNGLIAGDICQDVRVRHSGQVVDDVIEGAVRVLDDVRLAADRIETYKGITLAREEQSLLANAALQLRYGDSVPVGAEHALAVRRHEDAGHDLWSVYNRLQENLLRGGLRGRSASGRRLTTRAVTGVDQDVRLNRGLWTLADGMARLKGGEVAVPEVRELVPA